MESTSDPSPTTATVAPMVLTKKEKQKLEKEKKKALDNLKKSRLIKAAHASERQNRSLVPNTVTAPELKSFITFDDDMKPWFSVGEYVHVRRDFSPGKRQQEGYGFITKVIGHGAATLVDVRMYNDSGDGGSHKAIAINMLTPSIFGGDIHHAPIKRKREVSKQFEFLTPPCKKTMAIKKLSPIERLVTKLEDGASKAKSKGWYLRDMRSETLKGKDVVKHRLSQAEKEQLWTEIGLLESYRATVGPVQREHYKSTGQMKPTSATSKAATLVYLVETAYGQGKMCLARLRASAAEDGKLPPEKVKSQNATRGGQVQKKKSERKKLKIGKPPWKNR